MRELALFAGAGGGILASVLLGHEIVAAVEASPFRRRVLRSRQADGCLPPFPIFEDVRTFDGTAWRGRVDLVSGGFPCQPFSPAGKRRGGDDERNLWPDTARIIGEVRPRFAFLENSSALLAHRYFGRILGDLAESGYDAVWDCVPASAVGAPHQRDRVWILAVRCGLSDSDGEQLRELGQRIGEQGRPQGNRISHSHNLSDDASGRSAGAVRGRRSEATELLGSGTAPNADRIGQARHVEAWQGRETERVDASADGGAADSDGKRQPQRPERDGEPCAWKPAPQRDDALRPGLRDPDSLGFNRRTELLQTTEPTRPPEPGAPPMAHGLAGGLEHSFQAWRERFGAELDRVLRGEPGRGWRADEMPPFVARGVKDLKERLASTGDGQVPLCAAVAFLRLMRRALAELGGVVHAPAGPHAENDRLDNRVASSVP